jgi:uncharacterized protein
VTESIASSRATARFHVRGPLESFLPRERRGHAFEYPCARAATLKNAIEALGIPHTEIGRLTVNGVPATPDRIVREADQIEILPWSATTGTPLYTELHFVADAHLGGLARFLRMLGFDTRFDNTLPDAEIRRLAATERRIVLTRDRELLKCKDIVFGCYVHALSAEAQLQEVALRFDLTAHARPFTLCLRCNVPLTEVSKSEVLDLLPETVARCQERFFRCTGCGRVYWPGSHYTRMRAALNRILPDWPGTLDPGAAPAL